MGKTFSCRECGATGFGSGGAVAKHRHDEHAGTGTKTTKRRKKREKAVAAEKPRRKYRKRATSTGLETNGKGAEGRCLQICMDAFEDDGLDDAACQRILDHLWARFYPQAEAGEEAA